MEKISYELTIKKMVEGKDIYYLGKIDGLKGFQVEGDSISEVKQLSPAILHEYLAVKEQIRQEKLLRKKMHFNLQVA